MDLEALLEPLPDRKANRRCTVGKWYDSLDEKYQVALDGLFAGRYQDGGLTDPELTERINKAGLSVSNTVVHMHRRGKCACN